MPTPLPVLPGVYYAQLWGTFSGLRTGITLAWQAGTSATTAAADLVRCGQLAAALTTSWNTTVGPLFVDSVTGWDSRVYGLEFPLNPAATSHTTGAGANGTVTEAAAAAVVVRSFVTRRGRGSQSHNNLSPITKNSLSGDGRSLLSGPRGDYQTQWEDFIAAVQSAVLSSTPTWSVSHVQLSKKGSGAVYPITGYLVETLIGTERSRTPRP